MTRTLAAVLLLSTLAPAIADDVPPFMTGRYATSTKICKPDNGANKEFGDLTLDRNGIFGYESGCTFLSFHADRMQDTGEVFAYIAVASCGDDSGITRPDLITIIPENEGQSLRVQSQNEYLLGLASAYFSPPSNEPPIDFNYISRTYERCP